jgi:hypothetical protein
LTELENIFNVLTLACLLTENFVEPLGITMSIKTNLLPEILKQSDLRYLSIKIVA